MKATSSQHPGGDQSATTCHHTFIKPRRQGNVKKNIGTSALPSIDRFAGHQRAFVKVQDGCDASCSYCLIPRLRPRMWSRPAEEIVDEVQTLIANGHKEVVLCGVFLGAYGRQTAIRSRWNGPTPLPELLRRIASVSGLWRVRLSSLEPGDVTDELLEVFVDCPAVAPHLHLSLQSGSERILRRMNRRYGPGQFLDAVGRIRQCLDRPAVTTDVIVGFPGEADEDFAATLAVARQAAFSKIHIFPFSARKGTAAWRWQNETPPAEVVKARCKELAELERQSARAFRRQFLGQTVEGLIEQPNTETPPGHARALTDRYIEVTFDIADHLAAGSEAADIIGQVVPIHVTGLSRTGLSGRPGAMPAESAGML